MVLLRGGVSADGKTNNLCLVSMTAPAPNSICVFLAKDGRVKLNGA